MTLTDKLWFLGNEVRDKFTRVAEKFIADYGWFSVTAKGPASDIRSLTNKICSFRGVLAINPFFDKDKYARKIKEETGLIYIGQ